MGSRASKITRNGSTDTSGSAGAYGTNSGGTGAYNGSVGSSTPGMSGEQGSSTNSMQPGTYTSTRDSGMSTSPMSDATPGSGSNSQKTAARAIIRMRRPRNHRERPLLNKSGSDKGGASARDDHNDDPE